MNSEVFPEQGEIVVATVKKITQFGAFCTLDEFSEQDAFLHVSEVSSGWVRSVRDHVREGQKIVVIVIRIDRIKRQIDISFKRVSEAEKKRKMEAFNLDKRAVKLLERAAFKIGKKPEATKEIIPIIRKEYGDIYTVFEHASQGKEVSGLSQQWISGIIEVAKQEIKPKLVTKRVVLKIKSYASQGVDQVKKILKALELLSTEEYKVEIRYVGAPTYYVDITSTDYKTAEKVISKAEGLLLTFANDSTECQLNKSEQM